MNIKNNQEQFLEDMISFKKDLIKSLNDVSVEKYREEFKGRYSPERFKEFFIEKTALHNVFKYVLIRVVEESMEKVNVKLNEEGLKKWYEMSKNFRNDYRLLYELSIIDVKREEGIKELFIDNIYDHKDFTSKLDNIVGQYIPLLSKYSFSVLDANDLLTLIERLYNSKRREELQSFYEPSLIVDFLLQEVGLD